jgi:hypothetical protein
MRPMRELRLMVVVYVRRIGRGGQTSQLAAGVNPTSSVIRPGRAGAGETGGHEKD